MADGLRSRIEKRVAEKWFIHGITTLILINAVTLGLETNPVVMAEYGGALHLMDHTILWLFVIEMVLKLYAFGGRFFKNGWNIFDVLVIGVSFVPSIGPFAVLRTLRVFRVLRLVSVVPKMRRVVTALLTAIPGMASVMSILLVIFYVAAVMATQMFGTIDDPHMQKLYGDIGSSMFTLFQLMTLEGWAENIAEPTMVYHPMSWIFFVMFIIVTSFAVLNLFIGIIVDAMNLMHDEEGDSRAHKDHSEEMALLRKVHREIGKLRADVDELKGAKGKKK